jgi:hypothetical protein
LAEEPANRERRYLSYLLRLWREGAGEPPGGGPPQWRASLERPQGGDRLGFASLVDLFAYLAEETRSRPPGSQNREEEGGDEYDRPQVTR